MRTPPVVRSVLVTLICLTRLIAVVDAKSDPKAECHACKVPEMQETKIHT